MHRCEAMVSQQSSHKKYFKVQFVPCGKEDADLHHKLTRARGGLILDDAGEVYHHLYLCREHHDMAHDKDTAYQNGLLLHGYVVSGVDGRPLYIGPDEYLTEKYGKGARV